MVDNFDDHEVCSLAGASISLGEFTFTIILVYYRAMQTNTNFTISLVFVTAGCVMISEGTGDGTDTSDSADEIAESSYASDTDCMGSTDSSDVDMDSTDSSDVEMDSMVETDESTSDSGVDSGVDEWPLPYALWLFNGDLSDSIGMAHGSDPSGQISFVDMDQYEGATFGEASYVVVDGLAADILAWNELSIAIRIYAWSGAEKQCYLSLGLLDEPNEIFAENGFGVWLFGDVQIYSEDVDTTDLWLTVGPRPTEYSWHTLVWTFSVGSVRYYEDGLLISHMPYPMPATSTISMVIGGWYGYHTFAGILDQAAIYDRALTSAEVAAM